METTSPIDQMPLVGGTLVFDFLNTRGDPLGAAADEAGLLDYGDLVAWSRHAGILTGAEAEPLLLRALAHVQEARSVHARALGMRAYLYELFSALHEGRRPPGSTLAELRHDQAEAISHADLIAGDAGFEWSWTAEAGLTRPIWPIIHAATTLLVGGEMWRTKRCAGCAWWFLDETKNQSRRWCRMEDCGTAEKMRRYVSRRAAKRAESRFLGTEAGAMRDAGGPGG